MKQYIKKILLVVIPFSFLALVLYIMFRNSYQSILKQLQQTSIGVFLVMAGIGLLYEVWDAMLTFRLISPQVKGLTYWEALQLIFLGVFMNIATYGTGIKPAQTLVLGKKGINYGRAFSLLTMPYIYHKAVIVIYAVIMVILQRAFVIKHFGDLLYYMIAGCLFSFVIIIGLIMVCSSRHVSNLLCAVLDYLIKKERWQDKKEKLKQSLRYLYEETKELIRNKKAWCLMIIGNLFKMSLWYIIPFFAVISIGEPLNGTNILMILTTTAIMQLIIGVIPTAGGMVSTEVVYVLLFSRLFDSSTAGATMLLYRMATYYIPFLVSIPIILSMRVLRKK